MESLAVGGGGGRQAAPFPPPGATACCPHVRWGRGHGGKEGGHLSCKSSQDLRPLQGSGACCYQVAVRRTGKGAGP